MCDMEEFGRLENSEKTIAILGDRWWLQKAKQDGDTISSKENIFYGVHGRSVTSAQMLEVPLLGVGTVLNVCSRVAQQNRVLIYHHPHHRLDLPPGTTHIANPYIYAT